MPLTVDCLATYLTDVACRWRSADFNSHDFVFALKGRSINKYSMLTVRGEVHRFDNTNREKVVEWFGQMAADHIRTLALNGPIALLPIPGSKVSLTFRGVPRTAQLANAIAKELGGGYAVLDFLRFAKPIPSASEERGPREPKDLYPLLRLTGDLKGKQIVLVDDVATSGGHLQAAAAKALLDGGAAGVVRCICGGRADHHQVTDPFAIRTEEFPDFTPA